VLFALINIFIGVFNLVPLLPVDGGHVVIAVYEKIQERRLDRRRYFTDVSRLMPLTYVVVIGLAMLFFSTLYLDIANPLEIR
jgi:membrane-associated protease RseP (regulator of RpoE activity)